MTSLAAAPPDDFQRHGIEWGENYLHIPDGTPYQVWAALVPVVRRIARAGMWYWGDLLAFGEKHYGQTYTQALEQSDYSYGTLADAKWLSERIESSRRRELSWSHHREVAALSEPEQDAWLERAETESLTRADLRRQLQITSRERRHRQWVAADLPPGRFGVVYADPPWPYDFSLDESDHIDNQYPTMELEQICALEVADRLAPDCVLFLWATSPKLEAAFQVMSAWGFEYRTCAVWDKGDPRMGWYFRQAHELLLLGKRGTPPTPPRELRPPSVIHADRRKHSQKPDEVYELIERMYPGVPSLELFARSERPGWTSWGNQITGVS